MFTKNNYIITTCISGGLLGLFYAMKENMTHKLKGPSHAIIRATLYGISGYISGPAFVPLFVAIMGGKIAFRNMKIGK